MYLHTPITYICTLLKPMQYKGSTSHRNLPVPTTLISQTLLPLFSLHVQSKMIIHCLSGATGVVKLAGIVWYIGKKGFVEPNCPCLLVAFDNGRVQLMRSELDDGMRRERERERE